MRVVVTEFTSEDYEYEMLEIVLDETTKFKVSCNTDSMEDNMLSRNFSDCYDIPTLLRKAYEAGKNGEDFTVEYAEKDDE
jgi:hypothetical protein